MRLFARTPKLRWVVPVAVAVLLVGGGTTVTAVASAANTTALPARSAAQLLVDVQQASVGALSGTVVQRADLGIPELPGIGGTSSSSLTSLISGTHTLRVWYDGAGNARLAVLGSLGESDVIKKGTDLWTWSSQDNTATHRTLPAGMAAAGSPGHPGVKYPAGTDPLGVLGTPQQAAAAVLAMLNPSTVVTTDGTQSVAGRAVYQLVLQPRDTRSLVGKVAIAIDAEKHIPLRVQVFAAGQPDPAFEAAFTSVDFGAPDPAQFTFNPPPGATVTQETGTPSRDKAQAPSAAGKPSVAAVTPKLVGSGWTTVLVASTPAALTGAAGAAGAAGAGGVSLTRILKSLPAVSGSWGSGHLLSSALVSMVITDSGRIAVGAVKPELLYAALAAK